MFIENKSKMKARLIEYKGDEYSIRQLSLSENCEISESLLRIRINILLKKGIELSDKEVTKCMAKKVIIAKPRDKVKAKVRHGEFLKEKTIKNKEDSDLWTSIGKLM